MGAAPTVPQQWAPPALCPAGVAEPRSTAGAAQGEQSIPRSWVREDLGSKANLLAPALPCSITLCGSPRAQAALCSLSTQTNPCGTKSRAQQSLLVPWADTPREAPCPAPPAGSSTKAPSGKFAFCCSFVRSTVQRAIKTSYTGLWQSHHQQSAWRKQHTGRRKPRSAATASSGASCTFIFAETLRCVQLCTYRCIGKLQSKDSA